MVYIRKRDVRDDVRYVRNVTYSERQEQRASRSTDCSHLKCKVCCNSLLGVVKVRASVGRAGVGGGRMRSAKILCTGCSPICARRVCSLSRCVPCTGRQYVHRSSMKRKEQKRAASAGPGAASTSRGGCHRRRPLYHSATQRRSASASFMTWTVAACKPLATRPHACGLTSQGGVRARREMGHR